VDVPSRLTGTVHSGFARENLTASGPSARGIVFSIARLAGGSGSHMDYRMRGSPPAPNNDAVAGVGANLPPGPRWPQFAVAVAYLTAGRQLMRSMNKRFGTAFTMRLPVFGPTVTVTDPALAKELFQQPSDAVQGVDANLGLLLGPGSTFGLQGGKHRRHRKLLLPPFHGRRMRAYEDLIEQETLEAIAEWPEGREFPVLPSTMQITLNTILRAVLGAEGAEFDALRSLMPRIVKVGQRLAYLPWLRHDLGPWSPYGRWLVMRAELDGLIGSLIDKALADPALDQRTDVLALLLQARYDDGTGMSHSDITDELFTLVVAGHETTATELAWAVERLRRHPDVLARLVDEVDAGESALLQATVHEVLRTRPVIHGSARKVVAPSIAIGPWVIPRGYTVAVNICLNHLNEQVYENAASFSPDRFLGQNPDLYSWVPFGGGNRRCLGAAFANMEMQVVLRTILREFQVVPTTSRSERWNSKGVAFGPARGGRAVVYSRRRGC
jgi:cytochrome P450